jgi:putative phage-type endonuclease
MIVEVEQGSAEWIQLRVGMVTASRVADVMAKLKKSDREAADRANYRAEIVCERLTGRAADHFVSFDMDWGTANEPLARAAYEIHFGQDVDSIGFAKHNSIEGFGASPDGLIGKDGLLEIKCPRTSTHIEYLLGNVVPEEYQPQMLAEMACTGRQWCDFVSFDPRLPKKFQMFAARFHRDEKRIEEMEKEVQKFLAEVDATIEQLEAAVTI